MANKQIIARIRAKQGKFIKEPFKGDKVKIYMNDDSILYGYVNRVMWDKREKICVDLTDETFDLMDCDFCLDECKVLFEPSVVKIAGVLEIARVVAQHFHIPFKEMQRDKRQARYVLPRKVAHYLCVKYTDKTQEYIGMKIGGLSHSTVHTSWKRLAGQMEYDKGLKFMVDEIEKLIRA